MTAVVRPLTALSTPELLALRVLGTLTTISSDVYADEFVSLSMKATTELRMRGINL